MQIRIIGDMHQTYGQSYFPIIKDCEYSIQLGDVGFDYKPLDKLIGTNHVHFRGNHDSYNKSHPQNLGDFGIFFNKSIFFVRGAWSIDWKYRTPGFDWFEEEQLSQEVLDWAFEEYCKVKPKIMLSHELPYSILPFMNLSLGFAQSFGYNSNAIPTRTNLALDKMLQFHKPNMWFAGHYHQDFNRVIDGTHFMCLTSDVINYPNCKQRFFDIEV